MSRALILATGCTVLGFAAGIFAASAPLLVQPGNQPHAEGSAN